MSHEKEHCHAEIAQLQPLVGGTITTILDGGESFGFQVRTRAGKKVNVWVDCDPEGNGPGHLSLEPDK